MSAPLLQFLRAARSAGLRISSAESIDAMRAMDVVGYADRQVVRDTLSVVLAKTPEEKQRFAECFDLYFSRNAFKEEVEAGAEDGEAAEGQPLPSSGLPMQGEGQGQGSGGSGSPLGRMLLENDRAGLAAEMESAAEAVGLARISFMTQVNPYTRRIMERMGVQALEAEINRLEAEPDNAALAQRLREGRDYLRQEVKDLVQKNLLLFGKGETERYREEILQRTKLFNLDRRDQERMRVLVRAMARRLATRYARNRRKRLRGQLDARKTLRRNMAWGGIPFLTVWKQKRIDKPKLVVLCDVSGSVAALSQFLLMFLYSLHEALSHIRAFAFAGELVEVSDILEREPVEQAIATIMTRVGYGSSNYGASFADFEELAMSQLDSSTTVIILGDGRGNRTDPRTDLVQQIADRSKQVIWLNPEYRTAWGTGDSDMLRYAPYCRIVTVCNTLQHLEHIISDILRENG